MNPVANKAAHQALHPGLMAVSLGGKKMISSVLFMFYFFCIF